ncbi:MULTISPECIES: SIS domain-containing protein [unclassified Pseudoalteromonas]|uniref:SIS domain-containing protein n=1 Tax=unclassified Pseudoalteromonas TaxID=194690 RepID=UPI001F292553|nr:MULTISPECIES: SIS domain-containing protein [unclassified Pseudoalteromonas]MCF2827716.1 SIS domain-containing protein [Pseudoalteromonas sp. OF5H-5]MCF2830286.1 SIS domain-containing protein [Pseudoalteromonas sp. DL2-H6]MCF2925276.1 SIS domain-containing protein [Pseudoalteromonas sp. DL2-H1]
MTKQQSIITPLPSIDPIVSLTENYVETLHKVLSNLDGNAVKQLVSTLLDMKAKGGTLYLCGNGGSAANAIHLANDFTFGVHPQGDALKVEALAANSSVLTCLGNDIGYDNIFAHQLKVKASAQDVLLVLSGSGNSGNIIRAIEQAQALGMHTVGILGFDGGKAKPLLNQAFHFAIQDMQISEDTQVVIGHILMKALYQELNHG